MEVKRKMKVGSIVKILKPCIMIITFIERETPKQWITDCGERFWKHNNCMVG